MADVNAALSRMLGKEAKAEEAGAAAASAGPCQRQMALERVEQKSRDVHFLGLLCFCFECVSAASDRGCPRRPHWYGSRETTAKVVKASLLRSVKDRVDHSRTSAITVFNKLTDGEHGEHVSDIIHLQMIEDEEMDGLLTAKRGEKDCEMVLELIHLVLWCSWKTDRATVEDLYQTKTMSSSYPRKPLMPKFQCNEKEFAEVLADIRGFYESVVDSLVIAAFLPIHLKATLKGLPRVNNNFNTFLAHAFQSGASLYPWVECYLYNFGLTLEYVWQYATAPDPTQAKSFVYPELKKVNDRVEMPFTIVSRIQRSESCDVCNNRKLSKVSLKMYPLEYAASRLPGCYPRKVLMLHRPESEWKKEADVLAARRSVGIVCKPDCFLKAERAIYPALNDLLYKLDKAPTKDKIQKDLWAKFVDKLGHAMLARTVASMFGVGLRGTIQPTLLFENADFVDERWAPPDFQRPEAPPAGTTVDEYVGQYGAAGSSGAVSTTKNEGGGNDNRMQLKINVPQCKELEDEINAALRIPANSHPGDMNSDLSSRRIKEVDATVDAYLEPLGQLRLVSQGGSTVTLNLNFCDAHQNMQLFSPDLVRKHIRSHLPNYTVTYQCVGSSKEDAFTHLDYVRSTLFVATGAKGSDVRQLFRKEKRRCEYVVFAYEFDLVERRCCGGFLYSEHDERGREVVIGHLFPNMFDFFVSEFNFGKFFNTFLQFEWGSRENSAKVPQITWDTPQEAKDVAVYRRKDRPSKESGLPRESAIMFAHDHLELLKTMDRPVPSLATKSNRVTIKSIFKNWKREVCEIVQVEELRPQWPVTPFLKRFASSLGAKAESASFKFKKKPFPLDTSTDGAHVTLPKQELGSNDYFFEAEVDQGGGYPSTVATDLKRLVFHGDIYLCKLSILVERVGQASQTVKHFVLRDSSVESIVKDKYKNFEMENFTMSYSVCVGRKVKRKRVLPQQRFQEVIVNYGRGCTSLFHLTVSDDAAFGTDFLKPGATPVLAVRDGLAFFNRLKFHDAHFVQTRHRFVWGGKLRFVDFPENKTTELDVFATTSRQCPVGKEHLKEGDIKHLEKVTLFWGDQLGCSILTSKMMRNMVNEGVQKGDFIPLCLCFGISKGMTTVDGESDLMRLVAANTSQIVVNFCVGGVWSVAFLSRLEAHKRAVLLVPRDVDKYSEISERVIGAQMSGTLLCGENTNYIMGRRSPTNFVGIIMTHVYRQVGLVVRNANDALQANLSTALSDTLGAFGYSISFVVEASVLLNLIPKPWAASNACDVDVLPFGEHQKSIFDWEGNEKLDFYLVLIGVAEKAELARADAFERAKKAGTPVFVLHRDSKGAYSGYLPKASERERILRALLDQRRSATFLLQLEVECDNAIETRGMSKGARPEEIQLAVIPTERRRVKEIEHDDTKKKAGTSKDRQKTKSKQVSSPETPLSKSVEKKDCDTRKTVVKKKKAKKEKRTPPTVDAIKLPKYFKEDPDWQKMLGILNSINSEEAVATPVETDMDKCGFCFKEDFDLLRCSRCKVATYCTEKCGQKDARNHEKECREAQNASWFQKAVWKARQSAEPVVLKGEAGGAFASRRGSKS